MRHRKQSDATRQFTDRQLVPAAKSICLPACLLVCLFVCVPVCLSVCLYVCLSVCMSVYSHNLICYWLKAWRVQIGFFFRKMNNFWGMDIENTRWVSFDIKFTRQGFENACWHREACRAIQHAFSKPSLVNLI